MEKIVEISEYLTIKAEDGVSAQWENPIEGVLRSDEMNLLEVLKWQSPKVVKSALAVVVHFLEIFAARARLQQFSVRIRMVRTITRAYRRYRQRRVAIIQRMLQVSF